MTLIWMKSGSLQEREKLLESPKPEEKAEELGIEFEKLENREQLAERLEGLYSSNGVEDEEKADYLAERAMEHLQPALDGIENRVLYNDL